MWWEYVIVVGAVLLSLAWLVRHFTKPKKGGCADCGPRRPVSRLQTDIPVFVNDRTT